jgi:hypothetical protein
MVSPAGRVVVRDPGLLTGHRSAPPPPLESLLDSEVHVLRYLQTNLTVPEIASEHG